MAIKKETFHKLEIARKWQRALSDDMVLTHVVKTRGLKIKFVPQSVVMSFEKTTLSSLLDWTSRQLTIVRVYDPKLWKLAAFPQWIFHLIFLLAC